MKTLFLDFDGVLHANLSPEDGYFGRASELVVAIGSFPLDIVISSSWRFHYTVAEISRKLPQEIREQVVGRTGEAVIGRHARWKEIHAYCTRHGIEDWRALDDAWFEFPPDCPELLLCDGATGLGPAALICLRQWLVD